MGDRDEAMEMADLQVEVEVRINPEATVDLDTTDAALVIVRVQSDELDDEENVAYLCMPLDEPLVRSAVFHLGEASCDGVTAIGWLEPVPGPNAPDGPSDCGDELGFPIPTGHSRDHDPPEHAVRVEASCDMPVTLSL